MNARPADSLKIALAQLNPTVGDVTGNADKVRRARDPEAYRLTLLGRALMLQQTEEGGRRAEKVLEKAVALAPHRADAHYQFGLALRRLGRAAEANREFAIVERLNKEFRNSSNPM